MSPKAQGGKNLYGFPIGIIMLQSAFPRIPGDMGNASTWNFPILYEIVDGASPHKVVAEHDPALLKPFIQAAQKLEADGVRAITTNCGFLAMFQKQMSEAVNVPLFSSTLLMVPFIYSMLPLHKKVGIITINKVTLSDTVLQGAGCSAIPKIIVGLEDEEQFTSTILHNRLVLDIDTCRREHVRVAERLVRSNPDVGAILLECTNMPPYAHAIQHATGLPVFDIVSYVNLIHHALVQREYHGTM